MKNLIKGILLLTLAVSIRCSNESDPAADKNSFVRIYDNDRFNATYFPIDVKQTPDGGYLILGGRKLSNSNFTGTYLLRVDEFGGLVSEKEVSEDIVGPVGPLLVKGNSYYFFSMTPVGLQSQLTELDHLGSIRKTTSVGGSYPTAAYNDNGNFLLLRYDNINKESVIDFITPDGSILKEKGFSIGAGDAVEAPLINHFIRTGQQFPFQVGKTSNGLYYFNGFYNYTFSAVFTDLNADEPLGVVQGQQDDGGFSAIFLLEGSRFALARFNFGDTYLLPQTILNTTGITSGADLGGNVMPELGTNATVKIISTTIGSKEVILYASTTKGKRIGLYGYEKSSGKFLGSRYLGFSNPFEAAAMTTTSDGGMIICGTTYVAGRFPRICLFKLSKNDLINSFGKG